MKRLSSLLVLLLAIFQLSAQAFQFVAPQAIALSADSEIQVPEVDHQILSLDFSALRAQLSTTPLEATVGLKHSNSVVSLPMPDGSFHSFRVVESPLLQTETQARWPKLRTYRILDDENPRYNGRMALTTNGLTAIFGSPAGQVSIEPYATQQNRFHSVFYINEAQYDIANAPPLSCGYDEAMAENPVITDTQAATGAVKTEASTIKEFIMALTCTGEYANLKGGTVESVLASFVEAMSIANAIFENEVGVRVTLISDVDQLIYLNAASDPFINADEGGELLSQVRGAITSQGFPTTSYDMGHVFTAGCTDVGGVVGGNTCSTGKDRGVTCHYSGNIGFIIRNVFSHEVAHQFGVAHTFSNCPSSLGQLASDSAYEPGSGTTIMSYQGACGDQNLSGAGNNTYYHGHSQDQFITFITEGNASLCSTVIPTENTQPKLTLNYTDGFTIPISTPFELIASAVDEQDDPLTYCWEQMNRNLTIADLGNPVGDSPSFRSYPPTSEPNRYFPRLPVVINNTSEAAEVLPTYSRNLTFRCTVRDNNPEIGDIMQKDVAFRSTNSAGPFLVMSPNAGDETWQVGQYREVTWDVANTDNDLVNCQSVNVRLSADGGFTYPYTLLEGAANNGSAYVFVPEVTGNNMRIRVEAADNIFFDISNANFQIEAATEPTYTMSFSPLYQEICLPNTAMVDITTATILDYDGNLSLSIDNELPAGVTAQLSTSSIAAGGTASLMVDMNNLVDFDGDLEIILRSEADGVDPILQSLNFRVYDNDMSDLELLTPEAGLAGVILETDFSWAPIDIADTYDWEVSDQADFSNIIDSRYGITETELSPLIQFANSTLFYWRVRGNNDCGPAAWQTPRVFHTVNTICTPQAPTDLPIAIPGTGPLPTIRSEVFVPFDGVISDMNIPSLRVRYQPIQNFYVTLTSPSGTEVRLYDQTCFGTDQVRVGFDDEATDDLVCPPDNGFIYRPAEPLSIFDGESSQGTWTLTVKVTETGFGAAGELGDWSMEFCAMGSPASPAMVKNDTLFVPPGMSNTITSELLNVEDSEQNATELTYVVVGVPAHGELYKADILLEVGSEFTQNTINSFNLNYLNTDPEKVYDGFTFVVKDGTGGFVPVQQFNIKMTDGAVVGTNFIEDRESFLLFPNPATAAVTIGLEQSAAASLPLRVMDINGRVLLQDQLSVGSSRYELNTNDWPAGIYLIQLGSETQRLVKQ